MGLRNSKKISRTAFLTNLLGTVAYFAKRTSRHKTCMCTAQINLSGLVRDTRKRTGTYVTGHS